jgi:GT2 family glycosyltransferase
MSETVTIGVPVYQGEAFLEETLRSIAAQTHRDFDVVISLDGPQPLAAERCAPFLRDSRFRIVTQPERLGWTTHLSWLMQRCETPYWCYHQQDDLMDARYLEALVAAARTTPEGAVFYCDMRAFGTFEDTFVMAPVTGSAVGRQLALLYDHHPAVAFRGLTRLDALRAAGGVPPNEVDSFACDTVWMAAVARSGELRRVPETLYRKRYHAANEHARWFGWPLEKRRRAWLAHCAAMLREALPVDASAASRRLLWTASVWRLAFHPVAVTYLAMERWTGAERVALASDYVSRVRDGGELDVPGAVERTWAEIEDAARRFVADGI